MRRILFLPLMLLLAGCPGIYGDFFYGFSRYTKLDTMPDLDCVQASIKSTPGVATVDFKQSKGGGRVTVSGLQAESDVYNYSFAGVPDSKIRGNLLIINDKSEIEFHESAISLNEASARDLRAATLGTVRISVCRAFLGRPFWACYCIACMLVPTRLLFFAD